MQRPQPDRRSAEGWQSILSGFQQALENRLENLHTPLELHSFALRCLKDNHLREVYLSFCVEDVSSAALTEEQVRKVVFAEQEHENFEADLKLFEQTQEPSASSRHNAFDCKLRESKEPIDLD